MKKLFFKIFCFIFAAMAITTSTWAQPTISTTTDNSFIITDEMVNGAVPDPCIDPIYQWWRDYRFIGGEAGASLTVPANTVPVGTYKYWRDTRCGECGHLIHGPKVEVLVKLPPIAELLANMVVVPGGTTNLPTTLLDDDGTTVTISEFTIGKFEVTQAQWYAVMSSFTQPQDNNYDTGDNIPVYWVSWDDIVGTNTGGSSYTAKGVTYYNDGFCYRLSQLAGDGKKFRLPTEAEWEYAAKGGSSPPHDKTKFPYSGSSSYDEVAWCLENTGSLGNFGSRTVGTKAANELGIHDMSGNVWEWCSDYGGTCYYPEGSSSDPYCNISSAYRVWRGGSCSYDESYCSVSLRSSSEPYYRSNNVGFRLVLFF
jgi:formylglycine-generating enzyme required for sulfatase activity